MHVLIAEDGRDERWGAGRDDVGVTIPAAVFAHRDSDENHRSHRSGWLRAAVLGANDGLLSTAALLTGVAAGNASRSTIVLTGVAAMAAGAFSMAVGEYGSVSTQRDAELADIAKERRSLEKQWRPRPSSDGPWERPSETQYFNLQRACNCV